MDEYTIKFMNAARNSKLDSMQRLPEKALIQSKQYLSEFHVVSDRQISESILKRYLNARSKFNQATSDRDTICIKDS